jgi:G6PDH family F420-dependent oxidoreductase
MTRIGYHCSHEQFSPRALLDLVVQAERAGFACASASDHFHPWSERQGQSGFVWSWLGAAMERTSLPFRTVSAPGYRYHPAILAQAGATLSAMYPDRLWIAAGTGQRLNESITGVAWPQKGERQALLLECVQVMRALWAGETVTHLGRITVQDATLFTRPESPPLAIGAATTPETARWLGTWADGMITLAGGRSISSAASSTRFERAAGATSRYSSRRSSRGGLTKVSIRRGPQGRSAFLHEV